MQVIEMPGPLRTKSGRVVSDSDLDALTARAEEGFDLSKWTPKRGRPSLDSTDSEPSPRIAVRVPRTLHRRVSARAAKEGRTVSEVVRDLLAGYATKSR